MACGAKYRHRVMVQAEVDGTADDYNQVEKTWIDVQGRWCLIEPLTGKPLEYAKQLHDQVTHKITMRYFPGLTPDHRLIFQTRVFNILSVINDMESNLEYIVHCVEEV